LVIGQSQHNQLVHNYTQLVFAQIHTIDGIIGVT